MPISIFGCFVLKRRDTDFQLRLKNAEGIPILRLAGSLTESAVETVAFTLSKLLRSGHLNVVLNIEGVKAVNGRLWNSLSGVLEKFREHHGVVELVTTGDLIDDLARNSKLRKLFRLTQSERQAISRIKGLARLPDSITETDAWII